MKFFLGFVDKNLNGAALLLGFILLTPYLSTGFYWDDSLNSSFRGYLHVNHTDILHFNFGCIRSWLRGARLYPLVSLGYYFWYARPSLLVDREGGN